MEKVSAKDNRQSAMKKIEGMICEMVKEEKYTIRDGRKIVTIRVPTRPFETKKEKK